MREGKYYNRQNDLQTHSNNKRIEAKGEGRGIGKIGKGGNLR